MEGSNRSWSDVPQDVLELILKYLTPLKHLRFGSVCHSWRRAQRERLHPPAEDFPLYILCDLDDTNGERIELFSFSEKRTYLKPFLRPVYGGFSIPSSRGWLFLYGEEINFLFNPFIPNGCIDLPKDKQEVYFKECLFFSTPASPHGVLLLKIDNLFLPCRLSPRSHGQYYEWQEPFIVTEWGAVMSDVIFFQGKLYAVDKDGGLSVVDTLFPHDFTILRMKLENTHATTLPVESHHKAVLLESFGEVLLVLIVTGYRRYVSVFRANFTELEWVNVRSLGDRALLIFGWGNSFSVCTTGTEFRSNCVYYISYKRGALQYKILELCKYTNTLT